LGAILLGIIAIAVFGGSKDSAKTPSGATAQPERIEVAVEASQPQAVTVSAPPTEPAPTTMAPETLPPAKAEPVVEQAPDPACASDLPPKECQGENCKVDAERDSTKCKSGGIPTNEVY